MKRSFLFVMALACYLPSFASDKPRSPKAGAHQKTCWSQVASGAGACSKRTVKAVRCFAWGSGVFVYAFGSALVEFGEQLRGNRS